MMSGAAVAADFLEPVMEEAAAVDWNGVYIGAGIEGTAFYGPLGTSMGDISLILGGNIQSDQFVIGVEGFLAGYQDAFFSGWLVGGEARGGFLVSPEALLYGSLGAVHFDGGANYVTVGAGVEFMVSDSLSIDLEAKHWVETNGPYVANSISLSANWHL
jgi:opacity protein-like surface antigen